QHFWRVQQAASDFQTTAHAAGKCFYERLAPVPKFEQLEQGGGAFMTFFTRHTVQDAMYFHVFPRRQILVQAGILKNNAESFAHFVALASRIESIKFKLTTGWV